MLMSRFQRSLRTGGLALAFLSLGLLAACGDSATGPTLDGDISLEIEGEAGTSVLALTRAVFDGSEVDARTNAVTIPQDGTYEEDLEDGHDGYQLTAVVDQDASITLRVLSDGQVLDEDASGDEQGGGTKAYTVVTGSTNISP